MRNKVWLLIFLVLPLKAAWAQESSVVARLMISTASDTKEFVTPLVFAYPEDSAAQDPLLCTMVQKKIDFIEKIDRKILFLSQAMQANPRKVTSRELDELEALKQRRVGAWDFLSRRAPELLAIWKLDLSEQDIRDFDNGNIHFDLKSSFVNWGGDGLVNTPENLTVYLNRYLLRVNLKPTLSEYCLNAQWLTVDLVKSRRAVLP